MRILSVGNRYPPWSTGGYEVVWSRTAAWLQADGHEVRVLTTRPDPSDHAITGPPRGEVHRELEWYWRDHEFRRLGIAATAALERRNGAVLAKHMRAFSPDVVMWAAMGGMSLSLIERVRRLGVPAVGLVGDDWMVYGTRVD